MIVSYFLRSISNPICQIAALHFSGRWFSIRIRIIVGKYVNVELICTDTWCLWPANVRLAKRLDPGGNDSAHDGGPDFSLDGGRKFLFDSERFARCDGWRRFSGWNAASFQSSSGFCRARRRLRRFRRLRSRTWNWIFAQQVTTGRSPFSSNHNHGQSLSRSSWTQGQTQPASRLSKARPAHFGQRTQPELENVRRIGLSVRVINFLTHFLSVFVNFYISDAQLRLYENVWRKWSQDPLNWGCTRKLTTAIIRPCLFYRLTYTVVLFLFRLITLLADCHWTDASRPNTTGDAHSALYLGQRVETNGRAFCKKVSPAVRNV